jgi:uncharacterized protein YndB with AHSA1/START domain
VSPERRTPFNETHGQLIDTGTLRIQRRLPGPIERVWSYLTESSLRQQWLASGALSLVPRASFELVWRNDELSSSPAERTDGFSAESRATCQLLEVDPPRRRHYTWPGVGEVSIELESQGSEVMLTTCDAYDAFPPPAFAFLKWVGSRMGR